MASAIALVLITCVVYTVVLAGTVAFQLTGMDWEQAQFQALSAFTNCGYTTRASELVVRHPVRRRIAMVLIVTGYGAAASVIATLVGSISQHTMLETVSNLALLIGLMALIAYVVRRWGLRVVLIRRLRRSLTARLGQDPVPYEELLEYKKGFSLTRIEVPPECRLAGRRLRDCDLRAYRLQVLAIERQGEVHPVPDPDWSIEPGDHLVLYGETEMIQAAFAPRASLAPPPLEAPFAPS